jgi:UDP-GlcNAc:undecaprenyl-phosphate GlcNAc-1-phosphate transferase
MLTLALTPLVRRLAWRANVVAHPKNDRWHRHAVPLLGGVALAGGTLAAVLIAAGATPTLAAVIIAAGLMFGVGLVDDFRHLTPSTKLTAQIAVACLLLFLGLQLEWTASRTINAFLTILWFVGLTNAFNLLDNMDGLCAGTAAIAATFLALSVGDSVHGTVAYSAALAGAASGFLVFNFQPASIFMGDCGSLFLGSSLAALALLGSEPGRAGFVSAVAVPVLIMLIPIFDTTFVTVSRKLSARSASQGGRDHPSHRLVAMGFSERQAVTVLYGLAALGGTAALGIRFADSGALVLVPLLFLGIALLGIQLARVKVYGGTDYALLKDHRYTPLVVDFAYKRRVFEVLLDLGIVSVSYYAAYVIRFDQDFRYNYPLFIRSLPLVIACQMISFFAAGIYRGVWRYVSSSDLTTYAKGVALGAVTSVLTLVYLYRFSGYSRMVFVIDAMVLGFLLIGSRFSFRFVAEVAGKYRPQGRRALIYGAGDGGAMLVRELRNNSTLGYRPIGFIDDDSGKLGKEILGVPVLGGGDRLAAIIANERADVLVVSTGQIDAARLSEIYKLCDLMGTPVLQSGFHLEPLRPAGI